MAEDKKKEVKKEEPKTRVISNKELIAQQNKLTASFRPKTNEAILKELVSVCGDLKKQVSELRKIVDGLK